MSHDTDKLIRQLSLVAFLMAELRPLTARDVKQNVEGYSEMSDDELAALQTCLYLLEGQFAYAEPFRLALQNLALGRPGFVRAPSETAVRVDVSDPDYSPELVGRLSKLET